MEDFKAEKERLIYNAENNIQTKEIMIKAMNGLVPPVGTSEDFTCHSFHGYKIVYSIEEQPIGMCRHISISDNGNEPEEYLVNHILQEFGFDLSEGKITRKYIEQGYAFNCIQLI